MANKFVAAALLVLLGGCISRQEQADAIPKDDAYCQSIGAKPGSDAYTQCRLQLRKELLEKQADRRRSMNALGDSIAAAGVQIQSNEAAAHSRRLNCTSTSFGNTTNTSCY